jgi:1,4-alpha-glucan branching enzyme
MHGGYLCFILHAHLPFVRNPEYERFLEENWLFEAISETYLPLLRMFEGLETDGVPFKLVFSFSSTLCFMLEDELLQQRYVQYLERMIELAEKEVRRTHANPVLAPVARMYQDLHRRNHDDFCGKYGRRLLTGFDHFVRTGRFELVATAATHAYLPLYENYPEALRMQIGIGQLDQQRWFGKLARGFWLPECGYFPGLEDYLRENGIHYFFTSAHGVLFANERPVAGVFAPVRCPNGLYAFPRDVAAANAVWSPDEGYPADPVYRDFYRDIGFDLPLDYVAPYIQDGRLRTFTGFKYYAVTGRTDEKLAYDPVAARRKLSEHAENFIYNRLNQIRKLGPHLDIPSLISCPFDAELFGHWWFEGPAWLDTLFRRIQTVSELELVTPSEYLKLHNRHQTMQPSLSSWGNEGYSSVWLDGSNDWVYRHTHTAIERMGELARRYPNESGLKRRALDQAAREVLLSQASDWPFILHTGTTVNYATNRIKEHISNFNRIYEALCSGTVSTEWLTKIEKKDNIFAEIDYRLWNVATQNLSLFKNFYNNN